MLIVVAKLMEAVNPADEIKTGKLIDVADDAENDNAPPHDVKAGKLSDVTAAILALRAPITVVKFVTVNVVNDG